MLISYCFLIFLFAGYIRQTMLVTRQFFTELKNFQFLSQHI